MYWELLKMCCTSFQVETYKSFRPGDIVLAKVVSFMLWEKFNSSILNVAHDPWPGLSDLFRGRAVQLSADHGGERAGRGRGPQRGGWGSVQTVARCNKVPLSLVSLTLCEISSRRCSDGAHQLVWDAVSSDARQRVSQGRAGTAGVPAGLSHAHRVLWPHPLEHTASKTRPPHAELSVYVWNFRCLNLPSHSTLPVNAKYLVNRRQPWLVQSWIAHNLIVVALLSSILAFMTLWVFWHTCDCNFTHSDVFWNLWAGMSYIDEVPF